MKFDFENLKNKKNTLAVGALMTASSLSASAGNMTTGAENLKDPLKVENVKSKEIIKDSVDIASFCKTGTTEFVNMEMREAAKNVVRDFLKNVDFSKYSIKIVGKYSIERPWEGNEQLKEDRRILGEQMVHEVLRERFSEEEIKNNIEINSSAIGQSVQDLGYSREDIEKMPKAILDALIDRTQGIDINIERKKEIQINQVVERINQEYKDVYAVIVDQSKSMADEAQGVAKIVNNINKSEGREIKIVNLEGGNTEAHLKTLIKILESAPQDTQDEKDILVLTDEPDNTINSKEEYSQLTNTALGIAKEKNFKIKIKFFNPDQTRSGSKIIDLSSNPEALYLTSEFKKGNSPSSYWESKLKKWYQDL